MTVTEPSLQPLVDADAELDRAVNVCSLDVGRSRATRLADLGRALLTEDIAADVRTAFVNGVASIARAQLRSFPETIFWDFDFLARSLVDECAPHTPGAASRLGQSCETIVALHERFGSDRIRFQYAHDFVYGFDWAKWISRAPEERADVGAFGAPFLDAMLTRAGELVELIERDDATYPKLADDRPRNPFSFSREPEHERALLIDLARSGDVPVQTWNLDARPTWRRPYQELRAERAKALAIPPGHVAHPIA